MLFAMLLMGAERELLELRELRALIVPVPRGLALTTSEEKDLCDLIAGSRLELETLKARYPEIVGPKAEDICSTGEAGVPKEKDSRPTA